MAQSKQLKILSIDGGGIRGLSSLVILEHIMHRVRRSMDPPQLDLQPCQYFDLIGGTSTGGIIALMLGRLRMGIEECKEAYFRLGQEVFRDPKGTGHKHMFEAFNLEQAIKKIIMEKLGPENVDAPLQDPLGESACKTVVYALPFKHPNAAQPKAFRTYESRIEPPVACTIWQAARATSAAPTFFEPLALGSPPNAVRWIDAGMKFNNPSKALRGEAGRVWGDYRGYLDFNQQIACFLSLGTGQPSVVRMDATKLSHRISEHFRVPLPAVEVMKAIVTDSETVHVDLDVEFSHGIYHRFNVEQGLQEVELFQHEELERIYTDTEEYVLRTNRAIGECTAQMARLRARPALLEVPPHQLEKIAGNDPGQGQQGDEQLQARLERLRISKKDFSRSEKDFEKSDSYETHLRGFDVFPHLRDVLLQADIMEKQGRLISKGFKRLRFSDISTRESSPSCQSPMQADDVAAVQQQMSAFERYGEAFVLYRVLLRIADVHWTSASLEYAWVAGRIGGLFTLYGMRQEAALLLLKTGNTRQRLLGHDHKSTVAVRDSLDAIQPLVLVV